MSGFVAFKSIVTIASNNSHSNFNLTYVNFLRNA